MYLLHHPSSPHTGIAWDHAREAELAARTLRLEVICIVVDADDRPDDRGVWHACRVGGLWALSPVDGLAAWTERATVADREEIDSMKRRAAGLDRISGDHCEECQLAPCVCSDV